MPVKFGVGKIEVKRIFNLVKAHRKKIYLLCGRINSGTAFPEQLLEMSDEDYEQLIITETANMNAKIDRLTLKIEAVCEEALKRINLTIDLTVQVNRFGRIKIMGDCPVCSDSVDIIECLVEEDVRRGLRCTSCGAERMIS